MREIKFRAWGKNSHEFLRDYRNGKDVLGFTVKELQNIEDIDSWELTQFTGMLDRDGDEIYEGDIIETQPAYGYRVRRPIIWNNSSGRFNGQSFTHPIKVIGNIYENKELLK